MIPFEGAVDYHTIELFIYIKIFFNIPIGVRRTPIG